MYGITKSDLLRSLILSVQSLDEVKPSITMPIDFFNESSLINFKISNEDLYFLDETTKHLDITLGKLLESIILTCLGKEIQRLKENHPRANTLGSSRRRQYYFSEELADALCYLRDQRGESISLLLKEAILNNRLREVPPLPIVRKERKFSLSMKKQDWEKLDMIAVSSDLASNETASSLLINYYFEN